MLNLLVGLNLNQMLKLFILLLLAIDVVPIFGLAIVSFFGRKVQSLFNYDFGPRWQMYIGGIGAFIHEMLQIVVAFFTGHTMSVPHSVVINCFKHHDDLTDIDHYWDSRNFIQETGDFLVGVVPFYILSLLIYYIQKFLLGDPWNSVSSSVNLSTYLHPMNLWGICKNDFFTAFSGLNASGILFIILIVLLVSSGYNFSIDECSYATRGVIFWSLFQVVVTVVITIAGLTSSAMNILNTLMSFGFFISTRALFYLLVVAVIMLPFAIINKIGVARELMHPNKG